MNGRICCQRNLYFKDDPVAKEHVTALIYKNAELYKIGKIRLLDYEENSGIRLSIDTKRRTQTTLSYWRTLVL